MNWHKKASRKLRFSFSVTLTMILNKPHAMGYIFLPYSTCITYPNLRNGIGLLILRASKRPTDDLEKGWEDMNGQRDPLSEPPKDYPTPSPLRPRKPKNRNSQIEAIPVNAYNGPGNRTGTKLRSGDKGRNRRAKLRKRKYDVGSVLSTSEADASPLASGKPSTDRGSLLPPLLDSLKGGVSDDALVAAGLPTWEDFLGSGTIRHNATNRRNAQRRDLTGGSLPILDQSISNFVDDDQTSLPTIEDLFPPELSPSSAFYNRSAMQSSPKTPLNGALPVSDLFYRRNQDDHDDEELPFSAEQTDSLSSDNNQVQLRRNLAIDSGNRNATRKTQKRRSDRKMVRRGMEMLVGGIVIDADPPERSVEISYDSLADDWAEAILLNTKSLGDMFHAGSVSAISRSGRAQYCEDWVQAALKWDVCPKELRELFRSRMAKHREFDDSSQLHEELQQIALSCQTNVNDASYTLEPTDHELGNNDLNLDESYNGADADNESNDGADAGEPLSDKSSSKPRVLSKGFGKDNKPVSKPKKRKDHYIVPAVNVKFEVGVSRGILVNSDGLVFRSVVQRALAYTLGTDAIGLSIKILDMNLTDVSEFETFCEIDVGLATDVPAIIDDVNLRANQIIKKIGGSFKCDFAEALSHEAESETRWSEPMRRQIEAGRTSKTAAISQSESDSAMSDAMTASYDRANESYQGSLFLHSELATESVPTSTTNPGFGTQLLNAVIDRAKQRHPRVIAVGDVHGCIDELQDLLRECDFWPGDLVVFLGDLVCKGPDSVSVVQMAREIGAFGVRGNHDFEVIRWHQAIKSGVDPPIVGSEHFHIASCLGEADMKWLYSLPWYMSSKELGYLFAHAGFVSGTRLERQNPRLIMNMRSILPDGTVTSKFFNNWPWARLWDGPQTVLFGHDADRGLQQYEHAIGLDTGCVYGGRLTACILPEKRLVSVSARREYFKYRRKHYD